MRNYTRTLNKVLLITVIVVVLFAVGVVVTSILTAPKDEVPEIEEINH